MRGEEVTFNVRTIRAIPLRLAGAHRGLVEIRGEVYFPRLAFERLNAERAAAGDPLFANPRNAAAGTMRTLDPSAVARRGLSAWMYQVVAGPDTDAAAAGAAPPSHAGMLDGLRAWGRPVEPHWQPVDGMTA